MIPTTNERVDKLLTLARSKAAGYADAENPAMAYRVLLSGVRSAQRTNNSGRAASLLGGLWTMPAVKAGAVGLITVAVAALTRSRTKSSDGSSAAEDASEQPTPATTDASSTKRRFRVSPRRKGSEVTVVDQTRDAEVLT
jgi:hypothetical protein